jgi:hypothetical protein
MANEETTPEVEEIPDLQEETPEGEEDTTDWKAEALKLHGIAKRYKTRLDKVKVVPDEPKPEVKPEPKPEPAKEQGLSTVDTIAIIKADVPAEDIPEVENYAKFRGISISEALKTTVIKTLLAEKKEQRETAEATNTRTTRRSPSKLTEEQVLEKAEKGEYPQDPAELAKSRTAKLRSKIKN